MLRFFVKILLIGVSTLMLLSGLAVTAGKVRPLRPVLAGFGYCSGVPCWLGIDLNSTDMHSADRILTANGYGGNMNSGFYRSANAPCDVLIVTDVYGDEVIAALELVNCRNLHAGDVMGIFGSPQRVLLEGFCDWVLEYSQHMYIGVDGYFTPGVTLTLLPTDEVTHINFIREQIGIRGAGQWQGFTSLWRYRQLESDGNFGTNCG